PPASRAGACAVGSERRQSRSLAAGKRRHRKGPPENRRQQARGGFSGAARAAPADPAHPRAKLGPRDGLAIAGLGPRLVAAIVTLAELGHRSSANSFVSPACEKTRSKPAMSRAEHYRQHAMEAEQRANRASDHDAKRGLREIAREWRELAERAECGALA